jgi:hypothetical protein
MRRLLLFVTTLALLIAFAPAAHAQETQGVQSAVAWLRAQQQPDGSFPGFGAGDTADAVVALVAAGEDPADYAAGGTTPLDYLAAQAPSYAATGPGAAAKLTLAAVAAGADPTSFGGANLLELIGASYDAQTGQYGPDVYGHALALLAIRSVGVAPPDAAVQRTLALQLDDGGWSFDGSADTGSDTNTTSLVVMALAPGDAAAPAVAEALAYLKAQQNDDGGFPYSQSSQFGNASDANSTAAVLLALASLGAQPDGADWTRGGNTPLTALTSLQNASGAFRYQATPPDDNALATYQALLALTGATLPSVVSAVPGAEALVVPAAAPAPAPAPTPGGLPATGAPDTVPLSLLALLGLAAAAAGLIVRRRAAL